MTFLPDFPLETIAAAAVIVTVAYSVFGLTGFGAAVVGVPLLAHWLPIRFVVPMRLVFDLTASLLLGLRNRKDIARGELLRLAPFVAVGMAIGALVLVRAPERVLLGMLGAFVIANAAWGLFGRAPTKPISPRWVAPTGLFGGVFSALYATGGPIYTVYLARRLGDPARVRATIATLIFFAAWARLVIFSTAGLMSQSSLLALGALLVPFAVAGYFVGSHLHRRLSPDAAKRAIWTLLLVSGASVLWRSLSG